MTSQSHRYTTNAVCLKGWPYGDHDRILSFYSADHGIIRAIAKGVKKANSRLSGVAEIFSLSQIQFSSGKNLDVVSQYQPINSFTHIRNNILKLACATLFVDLVDRMGVEGDLDSTAIFDLLTDRLHHLNTTHSATYSEISQTTASFQLQLLEKVGYTPSLDHCVGCGVQMNAPQPYFAFSAGDGGLVCEPCRANFPSSTLVNVSANTIQFLRHLQIQPDNLTPKICHQTNLIKVLKFLRHFISHKLDKEPKTYEFLLQILESSSALEAALPENRPIGVQS